MPDVVAENRLLSKDNANRVSAVFNVAAAATAIGTAVALAFPEPAVSKAMAIRLGITSGVCWYVSAMFGAYALDPPRDDFGEVSESGATFREDLVTDEEPFASLHRFAGRGLVLTDALAALVRSLERYDGAIAAEDADAASTQAAAAQTNAISAADQLDFFQQFAPQVNAAWDSTLTEAAIDWNSVTVDQAHQAFVDAWGDPPDSPSEPMQEFLTSVEGLSSETLSPDGQHPILDAGEAPARPDILLTEEFLQELSDTSTQLRQLVA